MPYGNGGVRAKAPLLSGLFLVQVSADRQSIIGIDGGIAFFDMLHDSVLVDHDVGALRPFIGVALNVVAFQNAVSGKHFFVHVTEQRELDFSFLGKSGVCRGRVHADPKNFGIRGVDFSCVDSRLDRLELFGSATGESEHVNGEQNIFLAAKIAELDSFPLIAE